MTNKEYTAWLNREYLKQEPWAELTGKTWADMAKDKPWFKAACRRTITGLVTKPKRFRVPIPARRGINSVLGPYTTGRQCKGCVQPETLFVKKVNGAFISDPPWEEETEFYGDWGPWPPKNWTPGAVDWSAWKDARWIKTMFFSHCFQCKTEIEANQRALWNKQARLILCESDTCGKRAARERWAA